uniref:Rab-GAP TBC domain-containing protein n=1 Tax=Chelydra serpentina TaxID=8475 RepID=A0A8C3SJ49_CHESE
MKLQWKSVSEEQERRNSLLRGYRSLIERDVSRTDRSNKFYQGSENPALVLLHDVLMTYCVYNFDLGEPGAGGHHNFEESQESMKRQLGQLGQLLRVLDPPLCDFLDSKESGSLCFCFRWLLIWFKREFAFEDVLQLWEVGGGGGGFGGGGGVGRGGAGCGGGGGGGGPPPPPAC